MGDAHGVVVDDVGKVIGGQAVGLDEHVVVQLGAIHRDVTVEHVVEGRFTGFGDVLADDIGHARVELCLNLFQRQVQAVLIVFPGLALGFRGGAALGQLLLGAEAVIRLALAHKLLRIGQVHILALGLDVGADRAADVGAFVPVQTRELQALVDLLGRALNQALLVGILDAQDKHAVVLLGEKIGIKRRAQPAQMQITGGAGRKTRSDRHDDLLLTLLTF